MGRGGLAVLLLPSLLALNSFLHYGRTQDAKLTLKPNRSLYFVGESVVFLCALNQSDGEDWEYELIKDGRERVAHSGDARFKFNLTSLEDGGRYQCVGQRKTDPEQVKKSQSCIVAVAAQPDARLTNSLPAGGRLKLHCSVDQFPPWEFFFYRGNKSAEFIATRRWNSSATVYVSGEGVYWCRGGRGDPLYFTKYSQPVTIENTVSVQAVVTLKDERRPLYAGEVVTLVCNVSGAEWDYEWHASDYDAPRKGSRELRVSSSFSNHNPEFKCRGRAKRSPLTVTQWSHFFHVHFNRHGPEVDISVSQTWLAPGASITLTCSVYNPSSGWKFYWFRAVRRLSGADLAYRYEQLPGSAGPTQRNTFVVRDQKHTEGFACSAVRGEPEFQSDISKPTFVWSEDPHPSVSLRVQPNTVQHFRYDPVSVICEGYSTKWRLMRCSVPTKGCHVVRNTINSIFRLDGTDLDSEGVYWCESDIAFSNAVNITRSENIIMLSPAGPVLEGEKVTLGCRTTFPSPQINFYKDHKVISSVAVTKPNEAHLVIPAISHGDKGFYKCGDARTVSLQSWVSVTAASKQDPPFTVLLSVGLMSSVLLIVFLLLISRWRKNQGKCCRPRHNEGLYVNESLAVAPPVNQTETYSSLLKTNDEDIYETIAGRQNTERDTPDYEYDDIGNP